ncbi:hypothetical protein BDF22DRAFT_666587 [Syncephalis plumigaleata]|nr:hypothetical protein BDF22DRAFT_666587 [Syncephalis plumigaleata]
MTSFYDEIEIEDMEFDEENELTTIHITKEELSDGEEIARCPSCSLIIRVIYDPDEFNDGDDGETIALGEAITV